MEPKKKDMTMDENNLQGQIDKLNRKLDIILEEIELQKKQRLELADLKDDLLRVGRDIYQTTVEELDQVHDYMETGDVLLLLKKLLRNVKNLNRMFDALENTNDLLHDVAPISRELALDIMRKLDEFDRKGYFLFAKELGRVADTVVTSFSVDDVKKLGDNIVTILNTIKHLTQPDMLHAVNNALTVYKNLDLDVERNVSLISLIKEINTPEVKRGMAFAIRFLRNIAEQQHQQALTTLEAPQAN